MTDRTTKVTLTASVSNYLAGMEKASRATRGVSSEAEKLGKQKQAIQAFGASLLGIGTVAAVGVALAIKNMAEFDSKMSQVKTLSGATSEEMRNLADAALNLGQNIGFSASQVADAEIELVKAGVSVKDIMGGALAGALDLAAAGQIDVAQATQIAVSAMTEFGLHGKDVTHVADLLAAGADKALGGVDELGNALKYAGPVAASLGISLDSTVGVLAEFAQNGILADQAGTGLRGVLSSLTSPSQQASDTLKKYNVNLFDAQGRFLGLSHLAGELHDKFAGLTDAERSFALGQIFGNQQVTTATVLMKGGAQAVDKWTKAVNDQGFAAQQAAGKMDNLQGDVKKLSSAFQTDLIRAGGTVDGVLRGSVQTITALVKAFGDLPAPAQGAILVIGGLVAVVGLVGGAFLTAVPKIAAFRAAVDTVGWSMKGLSLAGGVVGIALTALVSAFAAFGAAQQEAQQKADEFKDSLDQQTGAITKNTRELTFNELKNNGSIQAANRLGINLKTVTDAALGNAAALAELNAKQDEFNEKKQKAIAAGKGDSAEIQSGISNWTKLANGIGSANDNLKRGQRDWKNSNEAIGETSDAAGKAADGIGNIQAASQDATDAVDALQKQLAGLGQVNLDVSAANIKFQQSIADVSASIKENGATLDITTQKGRDNKSALDDLASAGIALVAAQAKQGASAETLTATMQGVHDQFVNAAVAAGLSRQAAEALAAQYGLVPKNVSTAVSLSGADEAARKLAELKAAQDAITRNLTIHIDQIFTQTGAAPGVVKGNADGGAISGPGGPRDDTAGLFRLSNGEHVLTAADVAAMGGQANVYRFRQALHSRGYADGGAIPYVSAPAAPTVVVSGGGNSSRPIYTDTGAFFGMLREMANGEARLEFAKQSEAAARRARMGYQPK